MNFLAIDCTSDALCIVAKKENKVAHRYIENSKMQHSVLCMPLIEELLAELNLLVTDCDILCAVTGPGSFTGIRVGLSTILGFAVASKKTPIGLTTFQLLAAGQQEGRQGEFLTVVDAGKGQYYICKYNNGVAVEQPKHISLTILQELATSYTLYTFSPLPMPHILLSRTECLQKMLATISQNNSADYPLKACYVRKSQAEENLHKIRNV